MSNTISQPELFNADEWLRYSRHFDLKEVGIAGQQCLKSSRVLCVGAGGLGSAVLLYLAAAGVGTLGIIDPDRVELSNLQRQVLYTIDDLKQLKVTAAKTRLLALNPHLTVHTYAEHLTAENALTRLAGYDIVADGSDNFTTRYLINDACFELQKPHVHSSIFQFFGQCSVFTHALGPCYRCLYPTPPPAELVPNCAASGVMGVLPGILGSIQATEVIKLVLGIGSALIGRLLTVNAFTMHFQEFAIPIAPQCPLCHEQARFGSLPWYDDLSCAINSSMLDQISVQGLLVLRQQQVDFTLLDVREAHEYAYYNLGGKLIPLAELANRLAELNKQQLIVVYCQSGGRSLQATQLLKNSGFSAVKMLQGGILAWAKEMDIA